MLITFGAVWNDMYFPGLLDVRVSPGLQNTESQ